MTSKNLVKEIFILTKEGIPIYTQKLGDNNAVLMGGFISAINAVSKQVFSENFTSLTMGGYLWTFHYCCDSKIIFLVKSDVDVDKKKLHAYIEKLMSAFEERYKDIISDWSGDVSVFENVESVIDIEHDEDNWLGVKINKEISKKVISRL